jgi:DNA-binding CsgD family transcriptional regulator
MMSSPAQNSDLIAGFYAAAAGAQAPAPDRAGPGPWNGPLSALCQAFQADTGLIYRQSRPSAPPFILANRNWPEDALVSAIIVDPRGRKAARDPAPGPATLAPCAASQAQAQAQVQAQAQAQAQAPAQAPAHLLTATLPLDGTALVGLGLHRPAGAPRFTEADREALDGVGRHVAAALRLEAQLAAERSASAIRGAVLDLYPHGVLIANGRGEVLFANVAAHALAAAGGLTLDGGRAALGNLRPAEAARLEALITSVAGGGPGGGARVTRGELPMLAAIVDPLPLSLAAVAQPAGRGQSLVLITLRDLSATSDSAASHLMDLFGLTAAEAGIVPQLLAGDSVSLIAQSRGVAVSTVKAQAAKVLAKTGAANLRALATMIAALGCG